MKAGSVSRRQNAGHFVWRDHLHCVPLKKYIELQLMNNGFVRKKWAVWRRIWFARNSASLLTQKLIKFQVFSCIAFESQGNIIHNYNIDSRQNNNKKLVKKNLVTSISWVFMNSLYTKNITNIKSHCSVLWFFNLSQIDESDWSGAEVSGKLKQLREDRGYTYEDTCNISKEALGDAYDEKIKMFFKEHLHSDEEIRLIQDGTYRNTNGTHQGHSFLAKERTVPGS